MSASELHEITLNRAKTEAAFRRFSAWFTFLSD
jgi:hypothetical protein